MIVLSSKLEHGKRDFKVIFKNHDEGVNWVKEGLKK